MRPRPFMDCAAARLLIFAALAAADRATKYLAQLTLPAPGGRAEFLSLALHHNEGISFSLMKNFPLASLAASLLGVGILGFLCARCRSARSEPGAVFLWAGAVGNLTDRLMYGYVIDWLYVGVYINLADVWLCIGCLMILRRAAVIFQKRD